MRAALLDGSARLAEAYRAFGYRGHPSADALVLPNGTVVFTEVNAQVSGFGAAWGPALSPLDAPMLVLVSR